MMDKQPLILFDMDGVLVDTSCLHFNAWVQVADEYAIRVDPQLERKLRGRSRVESFKAVFEHYPDANRIQELACTRKNQLFHQELDRTPASKLLMPGIHRLLTDLKAGNALLLLASASKNARKLLTKTGLTPYFDHIVDGNISTAKKPSPAYYTNLLREYHFAPEETVLIEDSEACIRSATRLGIRTVAVNCPADLPADFHVRQLASLSANEITSLPKLTIPAQAAV